MNLAKTSSALSLALDGIVQKRVEARLQSIVQELHEEKSRGTMLQHLLNSCVTEISTTRLALEKLIAKQSGRKSGCLIFEAD